MELVSPVLHLNVEPSSAINMAVSPLQIVPSSFNKPDLSVIAIDESGTVFTVMVPFAIALPQPPNSGIE